LHVVRAQWPSASGDPALINVIYRHGQRHPKQVRAEAQRRAPGG